MTDPMDELRDAWSSLRATPPTEELEHADAETQAAVERLREAWRAETPAPPAALLEQLRARQRARRPWRRPLVALAAGLAAAAALVLALLPPRPAPAPLAPDVPEQAVATAGEPAGARASLSVPPERFRSRTDGIELTAGKVRLVLVQPVVTGPTEGTDDTETQEILR